MIVPIFQCPTMREWVVIGRSVGRPPNFPAANNIPPTEYDDPSSSRFFGSLYLTVCGCGFTYNNSNNNYQCILIHIVIGWRLLILLLFPCRVSIKILSLSQSHGAVSLCWCWGRMRNERANISRLLLLATAFPISTFTSTARALPPVEFRVVVVEEHKSCCYC